MSNSQGDQQTSSSTSNDIIHNVPSPDPKDRAKTAREAKEYFIGHIIRGEHTVQNCTCTEYRKSVNQIVLVQKKLKIIPIRLPNPVGTKFHKWASVSGWYQGITTNNRSQNN